MKHTAQKYQIRRQRHMCSKLQCTCCAMPRLQDEGSPDMPPNMLRVSKEEIEKVSSARCPALLLCLTRDWATCRAIPGPGRAREVYRWKAALSIALLFVRSFLHQVLAATPLGFAGIHCTVLYTVLSIPGEVPPAGSTRGEGVSRAPVHDTQGAGLPRLGVGATALVCGRMGYCLSARSLLML